MKKEERVQQLEKEIEQFDYQRLKKQEQFQQAQTDFQVEFAQINQGILTRRGGIIELKRLIEEGKQKEDDSNTS